MGYRAFLALAFATILTSKVRSEVVIYNCCSNGTFVTEEKTCQKGIALPWAPAVYSPTQKTLYEPGTYPDDWTFQENKMPECNDNETADFFPSFVDLENPQPPAYVVLENGSLVLTVPHFELPPLDPGRYCLNIAGCYVCKPAETQRFTAHPKVKKCCGKNAVFSERTSSCKVHAQNFDKIPNVTLIEGFPSCDTGSYAISGKLDEAHHLLPDGTLRFQDKVMDDFCLEHIFEQPNDGIHVFICLGEPSTSRNDFRFTVYPIGLLFSVLFLAITLVATCALPSTYHVLHWRCQTNYVACLLAGDLLLAVTQLSGESFVGPACVAVAIMMHFMFLSAFFWLNTMCFNIWWTFRDIRPCTLDKGQEACRLRFYELYAWGVPLVIAGIAAVSDHLPIETFPNVLKPRFGEQRCWFYGDSEVFAYFFGPIAVLLLMNVTLFAATARELTCGVWKFDMVKSNTERAALGRVCIKLVVVMGVTWVADVVSWAVGGPAYVWYITDIVNTLQGVLIFAVVGCQPQVWAALKRLWCLRDSPSDTNNIRSSSSNALPSTTGDQNTSTTTKGLETLC